MALSMNDKKWIESNFEALHKHITKNRIDIAVLQTKAGIWGIIGGAIPVIITLAMYFIFKGK